MEIGRVAVPAANALDRIGTTAIGSAAPKAERAGTGQDFASLIAQSLAQVDAMQGRAEVATHRYPLGQDGVSPDAAMIAVQNAAIAFETTVQVRDKIVAAYNDVMNMQL